MAIRDERRAGGDIGGVGELKDLEVTLVKLLTDLEYRMLPEFPSPQFSLDLVGLIDAIEGLS